MKYIAIFLCLISIGSAQRLTESIVANDDTLLTARTYVAATVDTSKSIDVRFADDYFLGVEMKDSGRIYINYQVSHNNSTWSGVMTKDSIVTTSNSGIYDTFDMTAEVRGTRYIRFIFDVSPYATVGTTTNTYTAIGSRRED